jgi:hypothetical protein
MIELDGPRAMRNQVKAPGLLRKQTHLLPARSSPRPNRCSKRSDSVRIKTAAQMKSAMGMAGTMRAVCPQYPS